MPRKQKYEFRENNPWAQTLSIQDHFTKEGSKYKFLRSVIKNACGNNEKETMNNQITGLPTIIPLMWWLLGNASLLAF